jgi:biotin carboxyl carrier protein
MSTQELGKSEPGPDEREPQSTQSTASDRRLAVRHVRPALIALIALILFAALVLAGVLPRLGRQKKITAASQAILDKIPNVSVVQAQLAPASSDLQLPGDVEAIQVATISAQTTGYLRKFHADIGDRVSAGQLLAEIDTPQVDQQLQQARADLAQAVASLGQAEANLNQAVTNMEYARVTYERNKYLAQQHVVSDQIRDQTKAAYDVAKATVDAMQANINAAKASIASNEANVRSLKALQGFQNVFSPFAGVITARNVEVGSLINPGSSSSTSTTTGTTASSATVPGGGTTPKGTNAPATSGGLFEIARIDTLRIFISVPQTCQHHQVGTNSKHFCKRVTRENFYRKSRSHHERTRSGITYVADGGADFKLGLQTFARHVCNREFWSPIARSARPDPCYSSDHSFRWTTGRGGQ